MKMLTPTQSLNSYQRNLLPLLWTLSLSLHLSSFSYWGLTTHQTLKANGSINGRELIVLVDPGEEANFLSTKVVAALGLALLPLTPFHVEVGNGAIKQDVGGCEDVQLMIQGILIIVNFFVMELGRSEVVLGAGWIASLGQFEGDYRHLTLSWISNGSPVTLRGDSSIGQSQATGKMTLNALKNNEESFLVTPFFRSDGTDTPSTISDYTLQLLAQFDDIFQAPTCLPPQRPQDHAIVLKSNFEIPNIRPYRYPHYQKTEIEKIVDEMLQVGIIRPNTSPLSSPVILVKKKDGGWRFCVDYGALNRITVPDKFPILIIEELLDELDGAAIFSKLELKSGYHQIRMNAEDIHNTAFRTHEGHYEFLVMPFGLTNAPSTFQALMNTVLKSFLRKFTLAFFDDILIYSKDIASYRYHLRQVFELLRKNRLLVNRKKCCFESPSIEYLGHIISLHGVAADPRKLQDMIDWPPPKDLKGL